MYKVTRDRVIYHDDLVTPGIMLNSAICRNTLRHKPNGLTIERDLPLTMHMSCVRTYEPSRGILASAMLAAWRRGGAGTTGRANKRTKRK